MAWTAPRTWVAAELVTAAHLNTHVRDNLLETAPARVSAAGQMLYGLGANSIGSSLAGTQNQVFGLLPGAGGTTGLGFRANGLWPLSTYSHSGDVGSISFTSISGTYRHLLLVYQGRTSAAFTRTDAVMRFNNDTGNNYQYSGIFHSGGGTPTGTPNSTYSGMAIMEMASASAVAGRGGAGFVFIPNYALTTLSKVAIAVSGVHHGAGGSDGSNLISTGLWTPSGAAINRIDLIDVNGGSFLAGTEINIYGLNGVS